MLTGVTHSHIVYFVHTSQMNLSHSYILLGRLDLPASPHEISTLFLLGVNLHELIPEDKTTCLKNNYSCRNWYRMGN
jgi:hypothetical protein